MAEPSASIVSFSGDVVPPGYTPQQWAAMTPAQRETVMADLNAPAGQRDWMYAGSLGSYRSELDAAKQAALGAQTRPGVDMGNFNSLYLQDREGDFWSKQKQAQGLGYMDSIAHGADPAGQLWRSLAQGNSESEQGYKNFLNGNTVGMQGYGGFMNGTNQSQGNYAGFLNGTNKSQGMFGDIYGGNTEGMGMLRNAALGNTESGGYMRDMVNGTGGASQIYKNMAEGRGPSVAEALYRKSVQDANANAASLAASSRGGGANAAAALRAAMANSSNNTLGAGNQMAAMRAQEQLAGAQGYGELAKIGAMGLNDSMKFGMGGFQQGQQFGSQNYGQGQQFGAQGYGQGAQFGTQGYNQGQQFGQKGFADTQLAGVQGYGQSLQFGAKGYQEGANSMRNADLTRSGQSLGYTQTQAQLLDEQRRRNDAMQMFYQDLQHKQQLAQQQGLQGYQQMQSGVAVHNADRDAATDSKDLDRWLAAAGTAAGATGVALPIIFGGGNNKGTNETAGEASTAGPATSGVPGDDDPFGKKS